MRLTWQVARALGDGRFHSGQKLAEQFGVSRTVIWRAIHTLETVGLELHSVTGKGYRLAEPVEWLEATPLEAGLTAACRRQVAGVRILSETDSTNQRLLDKGPPAAGRMPVCFAEYQSGGRGRRGRRWQSPPGAGLYLSVAWLFERQPRQMTALGLAAGLALRRALLAAGVTDIQLKWPNDLIWRKQKLGGLLIELRAESNGPAFVVIGVGLNIRIGEPLRRSIVAGGGLPVTDLATVCDGEPPGRNALAGELVGALGALLADYEDTGFDAWRDDWVAADVLADRFVRVETGGGEMSGTARGVDEDGALLVETGSCLKRVIAGDVTVRAVS